MFRCLLVWLATTALLAAALALAAGPLVAAVSALRGGTVGDQPFDTLLVWWCATVAAGCLGWCWIGGSVVVLSAARGRVITASRICPALMHRWLLRSCGIVLVGSMVAAQTPASAAVPAEPGVRTLIAGLPLPDRASLGTHPSALRPVVVVRAGDSLWGIADRLLDRAGPAHDQLTVARTWTRLYALNRATIGPDPDLIQPGQILRVPASSGTTR